MGSLSSNEQRKLAYFHALGKVMTESTQAVYETKYKSSHNVKLNELWADNIAYANNYSNAYAESLSNPAVSLFEEVELDMIYGSNGQSYCYLSGGTFKDNSYPLSERGQPEDGAVFIRPYISPVDVPHPISNEPSNGYNLRLFRGSNAISGTPNSEIYLTEGAWTVDYYAGVIHFAEGYTPIDLGWGDIKATFFAYTGNFGVSGSTSVGAFTTAEFNSGNTTLTFNKNLTGEKSVNLDYLNSRLSYNNNNMNALTTDYINNLACSTGITDKVLNNSSVRVLINGIDITLNEDGYFSNDGGITEKSINQIEQGDLFYWKYTGSIPNSGYDLNSSTDKLSFVYLTNQ